MRALLLTALVALTACGGGPHNRAATDPTVGRPASFTLPLTDGNLAAAQERAAETCRAQRRTARLLARHRDRAEFRCD